MSKPIEAEPTPIETEPIKTTMQMFTDKLQALMQEYPTMRLQVVQNINIVEVNEKKE